MKRKLNIAMALIGACAIFAPDLSALSALLTSLHVSWLGYVTRGIGGLVLLLSNWDVIKGKVQAVITAVENAAATQDGPSGPRGVVIRMFPLAILLIAATANAQTTQQFGGCAAGGKVCFGPSATITVGQFNLATSKFSGGVIPGIGYGATFAPEAWYATGLALYANFIVGQGQPNQLTPALMLSFANYLRVGSGVAVIEQDSGPVKTQWLLFFGLGSDFGGSPDYVRKVVSGAPQP